MMSLREHPLGRRNRVSKPEPEDLPEYDAQGASPALRGCMVFSCFVSTVKLHLNVEMQFLFPCAHEP